MNEDAQKRRKVFLTEVEYYCPVCKHSFVVYHSDSNRNTHCFWDGAEVTQTGKTASRQGDELINYLHGVEVSRRPIPELNIKRLQEKNA